MNASLTLIVHLIKSVVKHAVERNAYRLLCMVSTNVEQSRTLRSSHQRCSMKKGVLGNSQISQETPEPESLFNQVAGLRPATLLTKTLWHRCFIENFTKFLRTPFLQNTCGRLLLNYLREKIILKHRHIDEKIVIKKIFFVKVEIYSFF